MVWRAPGVVASGASQPPAGLASSRRQRCRCGLRVPNKSIEYGVFYTSKFFLKHIHTVYTTKVSIGQVTQYSVSLKRTHEKFSASRPPELSMIPGLNNEQIVKGLPEREFYGLSNGTFGFQIPTLVVEIFAFF